MPTSDQWADRLVVLAQDLRPHGARRWDAAGIRAQLRKVQHLALRDVTLAVVRAASDASIHTPAVIGDLRSSAWRERGLELPDAEEHHPFDPHETCGTCSLPRHRCIANPHSGHEFESIPQRDARARAAQRQTQETPA